MKTPGKLATMCLIAAAAAVLCGAIHAADDDPPQPSPEHRDMWKGKYENNTAKASITIYACNDGTWTVETDSKDIPQHKSWIENAKERSDHLIFIQVKDAADYIMISTAQHFARYAPTLEAGKAGHTLTFKGSWVKPSVSP